MGLDGGLSWADQWDSNPDPGPPPSSAENGKKKKKKKKKKEKEDGGSSSSEKSIFKKASLKWIKELRKKSEKS
ncbi:hypothetical protein SDJN02_06514, partial [Cucurbita argyrosperma subsp. argyrosperma]